MMTLGIFVAVSLPMFTFIFAVRLVESMIDQTGVDE